MSTEQTNRSMMRWCPFCEEEGLVEFLWQLGEYEIVRCLKSGLVFLGNPLSAEALQRYYSQEYFEGDLNRKGYASYEGDEAILRKNFRCLVKRITQDFAREGRDSHSLSLLDFGCAYGYFLDEARPFFHSIQGVELNEEVAAKARSLRLHVDAGIDLSTLLHPESLDVISMWDVIEHLSNPRSVLQALAASLRKGGRLYLTTGDIDSLLAKMMGRRWRLMTPPAHISYFSGSTLTRLLRETGFTVLDQRRLGKQVSLHFMLYILSYLLGIKRILPPRSLSRLLRLGIPVNLFDVTCVAARKL